MDETPVVPAGTPTYQDEDLVYVDVQNKCVVGLVEFQPNGLPKKMPMPMRVMEEDDDEPAVAPTAEAPKPDVKKGRNIRPMRKPRQRYYPWGTYRSMKRVYKIEGMQPRVESTHTLDEVIGLALQEPFWD